MEITPTAAVATAASSTGPATISSDFETFLSLLTAQLSNQDPLDPMKSEDFAAQLATFSMVEQQTYSNELLESMLSQADADSFATMSAWVDREVRAQMPVAYDGAPVTVDPDSPVAGSRHELVVTNASGRVVDRVAIGATGEQVIWSGSTSRGEQVPAGVYSFSVESFEKGELVATAPAATYAAVEEVRQTRDGPVLAFGGDIAISAAEVTAIRRPG